MGDGKLESKDPSGKRGKGLDLGARIRAVGIPVGRADKKRRLVCKVRCQGCGKEILSDGDLSGVEYVKTRRGSELFFHTACMDDIWKCRIV